MNCFPPIPLPVNGVHHDSPVEEEYEEMSMNEIMNGKVRRLFMRQNPADTSDCKV